MTEIKDRLIAISTTADLLNSGEYPYEPYMAAEFCLLQLRMVCELFAVACLIAHEKLPATREAAFRNLYSADRIMNELGKLHADSYPQPVTVASEGSSHHATPVTDGYLTRDDLKKLYAYCLDRLHRGKAKDFFDGRRREYDWSHMIDFADKIVRLLTIHMIKMADSDERYIVYMSAEADQKVHLYVIAPVEDLPE